MSKKNISSIFKGGSVITEQIPTTINYVLIIFILILIIIILYLIFMFFRYSTSKTNSIVLSKQNGISSFYDFINPFIPPLKDNKDFIYDIRDTPSTPINIHTQPEIKDYTQIGILTNINNKKNNNDILPLFGRKCLINRDRYNYYTTSNSGISPLKLPVKKNGKNCMNENGCNELYNEDEIYVEGLDGIFKATIYENQQNRYIPYV
jgi:hypothetical protein